MMMMMTMMANTNSYNSWKKVRRYIYIVYSSDTDGHPFVVLGQAVAGVAAEVGDTQTSVLLGTIRMRQIRVQYSQADFGAGCLLV
jgi:hypothetical protein